MSYESLNNSDIKRKLKVSQKIADGATTKLILNMNETSAIKSDYDILKLENKNLKEKCNLLYADNVQLKNNLKSNQQQFIDANETFSNKLSEANIELDTLKKYKNSIQIQQKELQDKFFSLECENGNLKAHITHLGNALEKLSSTTENHFQELNISDKNLKDHINKNGILNSKILELQFELEHLKKSEKKYNSYKSIIENQNKELNSRLISSEKEIFKLNNRLESCNQNYAPMVDKIKSLENDLKSSEENRKEEKNSAILKYNKLKQDYEEVTLETQKKYEHKIKNYIKQIESYVEERNKMDKNLENLHSFNLSIRQSYDALNLEHKKQNDKMNSLNSEFELKCKDFNNIIEDKVLDVKNLKNQNFQYKSMLISNSSNFKKDLLNLTGESKIEMSKVEEKLSNIHLNITHFKKNVFKSSKQSEILKTYYMSINQNLVSMIDKILSDISKVYGIFQTKIKSLNDQNQDKSVLLLDYSNKFQEQNKLIAVLKDEISRLNIILSDSLAQYRLELSKYQSLLEDTKEDNEEFNRKNSNLETRLSSLHSALEKATDHISILHISNENMQSALRNSTYNQNSNQINK